MMHGRVCRGLHSVCAAHFSNTTTRCGWVYAARCVGLCAMKFSRRHSGCRTASQSASLSRPCPPEVDRVAARELSVDDFTSRYLTQKQPVLISSAVSDWKAMSFHESSEDAESAVVQFLQHASALCADTMADVEVGVAYTSAERVAVNVGDFLEVLSRGGSKGTQRPTPPGVYLAQQQLFNLAPRLRELIDVPRFVRAGRGDAYATNAWIGPPGTVSPLHRDPTDNLLAQLYGEKRVLLYSERDIDRDSMYPHMEPTKSNTSRVDPELSPEDLHRLFPKFPSTPSFAPLTLHPGDALYIPRGVWHHIRALTGPSTPVASVSVNFFFD